MNKEYEETQKEIDKLLLETSQKRTYKKYQEMKTDEKYKSAMKKIGKLTMKLEEKQRNNYR